MEAWEMQHRSSLAESKNRAFFSLFFFFKPSDKVTQSQECSSTRFTIIQLCISYLNQFFRDGLLLPEIEGEQPPGTDSK